MSSFSRRFFLFGSTACLGACGFTPVYGPQGTASRLLNNVQVDDPKDRAAFLLTSELEDRLGRASAPRYGLSYAIAFDEEPIAVSASNVTTRFNLLGKITYALRDLNTGAVVNSGKVESFTSYSASGSTVATQAAEKDAQARLMTILADQVTTRLFVAADGLPA